MSRPIAPVTIWTTEGLRARVRAVFDSGSEHCIVRESALPRGALISRFPRPQELRTAGPKPLSIVGLIALFVELGNRRFYYLTHVASNFPRALVIGADAMHLWRISIVNQLDGKTKVVVGLDMRSPQVMEVI